MNRVVAATAGTAAVMATAALVSQAVPADPVGMILMDPVVPMGMILMDPVVPMGMILVDPVVPMGMSPGDPERLGVPNPVGRVDPGNREATDPSLGRELMVLAPMRLHLTVARPLPMPALLRPTPADRRQHLTTRAVATCQEAPPAEATRAVAVRRAEATRKAELNRICPSRLLLDPEHRVDLVAHDNTAGVGVGLGRVEMIHHVGVADPVLEVDETERAAEATVAEDRRVRSVDAALVEHVAQAPAMVGDARAQNQIALQAAL
jgi:hypothetical protein